MVELGAIYRLCVSMFLSAGLDWLAKSAREIWSGAAQIIELWSKPRSAAQTFILNVK